MHVQVIRVQTTRGDSLHLSVIYLEYLMIYRLCRKIVQEKFYNQSNIYNILTVLGTEVYIR